MIQYLKRAEINDKMYNACIKKSIQSNVYAYAWYLDIVTPNWSVLVLNNYEAVMPLPAKKKYFINYIAQPFFVQQLGVFSLDALSDQQMTGFITKIPKKYKKVLLNFNVKNKIQSDKISVRTNYILPLQKSHQEIVKGFSKGRKHAIGVANKSKLLLSNHSFIDELIAIAKEYYPFLPFKTIDYKRLKNLLSELEKRQKGCLKIVTSADGTILGGAIFLVDATRITYLFAAYTAEGKKLQAPSFLLNEMIKKYATAALLLDFEGSMVESIASFFRSFGAVKENYYQLIK